MADVATDAGEGVDDDDRSEEALAALFMVTGAALFVLPEPVTSAVGAALVLVGACVFLADRFL
jgi:ABC-type thiamine transport system substrate-binding protein